MRYDNILNKEHKHSRNKKQNIPPCFCLNVSKDPLIPKANTVKLSRYHAVEKQQKLPSSKLCEIKAELLVTFNVNI